ncbi:MAG: WD40/YVTN/BNR-like repeat-containing protein, partial [Flavobacteriales bacterium]
MMRKQKSNYYKLFPVAPIMDGGRRGYSTSASSSVALLTNVTAKLNKVRTVSSMGSDDVYVVGNGGVILKGLNGSNMTQMTISGFNSNLYDIAISNGISLAVGQAGQIVKYNGTNWVPVNNMEALALNATDMIGASGTGYGVGKNGMIAKTEDAGYTWTKIDTKKTQSLYGVAFRDNVNGVAVGDNGAIMRTVNGGLDYFKATVNKPSGLIANLKAVQWVNDKLGFIAGAGGMVLKTIDGGVNWTTETTGSTSDFTSVYFPDKQVGYAVGSNKAIYKAQLNIGTGVYAWTATPELDPAASAFNLNSVYFVDREIGYVSGTGGRLYKTINGGDSWVKDANVSTSAGSNNIGKIIPVDRTNFFVAGAGTTLTHVNDEKDQYSVKLWYDELGRVV